MDKTYAPLVPPCVIFPTIDLDPPAVGPWNVYITYNCKKKHKGRKTRNFHTSFDWCNVGDTVECQMDGAWEKAIVGSILVDENRNRVAISVNICFLGIERVIWAPREIRPVAAQ